MVLTVLYLALTVLYLILTDLYLAVTVAYAGLGFRCGFLGLLHMDVFRQVSNLLFFFITFEPGGE